MEGVVTSRYSFGQGIRTSEGSLLVGADGKFSTGKANHYTKSFLLNLYLAVRGTFDLRVWPAVTYVSTLVVSWEQHDSEFKRFLDKSGTTSVLIGKTRLELSTTGTSADKVHMSLCYSRMTTSDQDYLDFFGFLPDEREIPRVEYKFNVTIAEEIDSLQPLPLH